MANVVIIGMQWGDEGKGKIVDLICPAFDAVARYQGGHNAGHTVKFGNRHFSLHLIPSGVVHEGMRCILGNGMVVSPEAFFSELDRLVEAVPDAGDRLFVSDRVQILLPGHATVDQAREIARGGKSIGTTGRGIGPAYESKMSRCGLRAVDLYAPDLEERLATLHARQKAELGEDGVVSLDELVAQCRAFAQRLRPFVRDTARMLHDLIAEGSSVLFEGAQGTLLDIDHGTYPFVTSSNCSVAAACTGTGVPPRSLDGVIGILKAYTSRVGAGPFPTELHDEMGEELRRKGHEFGTTTGRPRRCGWLDTVASAYTCRVNGVDGIALTKLDILDDLDEIPVCVAYRIDGERVEDFPADLGRLERVEPVYEVLPGWRSRTTGLLELDEMPQAARDYIRFVEEKVGAPVSIVSTGPRREETILDPSDPVLKRLTSGRLERILAERGA